MTQYAGVNHIVTSEGNVIFVDGLETTIYSPGGILESISVTTAEGVIYKQSVTYPAADTITFSAWVKQ